MGDGTRGGEEKKRKEREKGPILHMHTQEKTITHPSSPQEHTCLNSVFEFLSNLKNASFPKHVPCIFL